MSSLCRQLVLFLATISASLTLNVTLSWRGHRVTVARVLLPFCSKDDSDYMNDIVTQLVVVRGGGVWWLCVVVVHGGGAWW